MKLTIFLSALLAALLPQSLADDSVTLTNQGNDGGSVHQTVNINNEKNIANINTNVGMNSWNSIWDYNTGFIALRPFAKKSCYIHRMNRNVVPSIQELARLTKEKKDQKAPAGPPPRSLQYSVTSAKAENFEEYGKPIEAMCRGVPSYVTEEDQGEYPPALLLSGKMVGQGHHFLEIAQTNALLQSTANLCNSHFGC
ncbi:hypothetical protein NDU88_004637 [Pleurodeles waltl]|uniref:Gastrokine-1 n=1 Tax=Pleurodeles waltl TaxID=8319 RepID=A0AAV7LIP0_PLEWA|nr:hypothetical protein NDU88_004637 [Pleurodeles waltl]